MSYFPSLSQLIASGYSIQLDSSGFLAVFKGAVEMMFFDANGNLNYSGAGLGNGNIVLINAGIYGSGSGGQEIKSRVQRYQAITTVGAGVPPIVGLDNRSGITVADGSPITLYTTPADTNQLYDAAIEIDATAFTSGTATYTLTYTENGVTQTIPVTSTVINVVSGVRRLIQPDPSTAITVQLTGAFVATVRLSAAVLKFSV